MGFQSGQGCLTNAGAVVASASVVDPIGLTRVEQVGEVYQRVRYEVSGASLVEVSRTVIPLDGLPSCDAGAAFLDGQTIGWAMALAVVIAWGWRQVMRAAQ